MKAFIDNARIALSASGDEMGFAVDTVPSVAGLYAIHGSPSVWKELGLLQAVPGQPLYVGKAEMSLASRDVQTHFATGKTGSSTVRRSFAALLKSSLDLNGMPRNRIKPGHFANFGIDERGDARLTRWMLERLTLSVWIKPDSVPLRRVEVGVLRILTPPLNLTGVPQPSAKLKAQRKVLADEARAWAQSP